MSDWRETLRSFSELCCGGNEDVADAIDAALAEIGTALEQIVRLREERDGFEHTLRQANLQIDRLTTLVQACGNTECMPLVEVDRLRSALKEIDRLRQLQDEAITRLKAQRDRAAEKGYWNDVNATDETLAMLKGLRDDPR
jgi:hypothetical protein